MSKGFCFIILSILFLVASMAMAGESPYNPNRPTTEYLFCRLHDVPARNTYFTAVFMADTKNLYPLQDAFLHFAAKKYSYKIVPGVDQYNMPVQCTGFADSAEAKRMKEAQFQDEPRTGFKAVETGWTSGSEKAVEGKPAASSSSNSSNGSAPQDDKLDSFTMTTLQQDPRGLNLSPLDRQFVLSEAPKAKSYCAKDPDLSKALDCTCFVRTVFNYRIAHASGPIQQTNFPPLASILTKPDFTCSECVNKNGSHNAVACDHANHSH